MHKRWIVTFSIRIRYERDMSLLCIIDGFDGFDRIKLTSHWRCRRPTSVCRRRRQFDIVAKNGNNVEATFDFVERTKYYDTRSTLLPFVATSSNVASTKSNLASPMLPVASTLLLVWTGLKPTRQWLLGLRFTTKTDDISLFMQEYNLASPRLLVAVVPASRYDHRYVIIIVIVAVRYPSRILWLPRDSRRWSCSLPRWLRGRRSCTLYGRHRSVKRNRVTAQHLCLPTTVREYDRN